MSSLHKIVTLIFIAMLMGFGSPVKPTGVDIGKNLPSSFEPSGSAWHPRLKKIFVVSDDGDIALMNADGSNTQNWSKNGNWEGVAVANPESQFVYLVNEKNATIHEFNFVNGTMTNRIFNLKTARTESQTNPLSDEDKDALTDGDDDNTGAESLTFVPSSNSPTQGEFYVGSQENGKVYRFRLSLESGDSVTYLGQFKNWNYNDLSGLEYDWNTKNIWAVFDSENRIRSMQQDGTLIKEWNTPTGSQDEEGIAINGSTLFIAQDKSATNTPTVKRYDNFSK